MVKIVGYKPKNVTSKLLSNLGVGVFACLLDLIKLIH